jgi:hypothetical protein
MFSASIHTLGVGGKELLAVPASEMSRQFGLRRTDRQRIRGRYQAGNYWLKHGRLDFPDGRVDSSSGARLGKSSGFPCWTHLSACGSHAAVDIEND